MKETKLILVKSANNVDEITENKLENIENTKSKNTNIRSDKSTKQFKDGIYITINPQNPNIPIASPHSVYLVNFTSMDIYFVLLQSYYWSNRNQTWYYRKIFSYQYRQSQNRRYA